MKVKRSIMQSMRFGAHTMADQTQELYDDLGHMVNTEVRETLEALRDNAFTMLNGIDALLGNTDQPEEDQVEMELEEESDVTEPQDIQAFAREMGLNLPDDMNGFVVKIDVPGFEQTQEVLDRILDSFKQMK